jgi:hypothetical protein
MKYEPIYKLPYSNAIITDLLFKITYRHFNAVAVIKNGKWELFIERDFLKEIAEKRYQEVLAGLDFKEFETNSLKLAKELLSIKNIDVKNMNKNEFISFLDKMFDIGGRFMANYSKTEFIYFRKIEEELGKYIKGRFSFEDVLSRKMDVSLFPDDKRKLAEYIINMQHLKFELRKIVNEVWMGPDALLSRVLSQLVEKTGREDGDLMTLEEIKDCLNGVNVRDVSDRKIYSYIFWDKDDKLKIISGR